ncbi:sugar ABC transporter ATP-binding protein [Enterovibrio calviensis]|uniref:sugar ABC transporter ATP-binding protein n=1 Tax=Enterovibrio calviensis TaxID=91359 RepID=UPI0005514674|nr:sugar ABC transporter ATP-binding protein [Enterovibrio calviensis]
MQVPLWEVKNLTKWYPGVLANDHVSIRFEEGSIHGLLGENGCGKSTLIKTLSGVQKPDEGELLYRGEAVTFQEPLDAFRCGIATVFQEFSVVPTLSVAENVFLGRMPTTRWGAIDWDETVRQTERVLEEMDVNISPNTITADLSVGEQQLVEIAKALAANAKMIILDEPTAALGIAEIDSLHRLLRRMRDKGCAILYVSHRLDEVEQIVDEVTILRSGRVVERFEQSDSNITVERIVSSMMGESVDAPYPKQRNSQQDVLLEVSDLKTKTGVSNTSFSLHRGEVLGLGGVLGSGRTEIANALYGIDPLVDGRIALHGKAIEINGPIDALQHGIALVPENRKFDGLFFNFTAKGNITSSNLSEISRFGCLDIGQEEQITKDFIEDLEISPTADQKSVGLLSGGNQQKIVIARCLFSKADVLILDEPTQGIDIGAKLAVYNLINKLTEKGKAIILISSDHDELLAMSDRIALVRHGKVVSVRQAKDVDHHELVKATSD